MRKNHMWVRKSLPSFSGGYEVTVKLPGLICWGLQTDLLVLSAFDLFIRPEQLLKMCICIYF